MGFAIVCFHLMILLTFTMAQAKESEIHWAFPNVDDEILKVFEEQSPYSPKGYLIEQIKAGLPEYKHTIFAANNKRVVNDLKKSSNTCFIGALQSPERDQFTYRTSYGVIPPIVIIISKSTAKTLPVQNRKISLEFLLKQKNLTYAFTDQRVFGPQIDETLRKVGYPKDMLTADHMLGNNFIRMAGAKRISYTLEHPFFFEQYQKLHSELKDLTYVIPSEEKHPLEINVMCSKSSLGLEVIRKVDKLIRKLAPTPEYRKRIMISHTEFDDDPEFKKQVDDYLRKRARESSYK